MPSPIVAGQNRRTLPHPLRRTNAQQATAQEAVFIELGGTALSADNRRPVLGIAHVSHLQSGVRAQLALLSILYPSLGSSALGIAETSIVPIVNLGIGDLDRLQALASLTVKRLIGHELTIEEHSKRMVTFDWAA